MNRNMLIFFRKPELVDNPNILPKNIEQSTFIPYNQNNLVIFQVFVFCWP